MNSDDILYGFTTISPTFSDKEKLCLQYFLTVKKFVLTVEKSGKKNCHQTDNPENAKT